VGWGGGSVGVILFLQVLPPEPVDAAEAEAAGESGDESAQDDENHDSHDQKREAGNQRFGGRAQDGVNHGDQCMEKDHSAIGREMRGW
jgi:hypothetical protein